MNQCLLAYLADGKNRLVIVRDENKTIVGRCVMRLLWDDVLKKPVIFQERYYERVGAPKGVRNAINAMFKERAKELGMPLVCTLDRAANAANIYPNNLHSLSCQSPDEYVDAVGLKYSSDNRTYTISAESIQRIE